MKKVLNYAYKLLILTKQGNNNGKIGLWNGR